MINATYPFMHPKLQTGFGLAIGLIGLFDAARDYNSHFTLTYTSDHGQVLSSRCFVAASNGGRSPSSGFPNCLRAQLPASHSNSSQGPNPSGYLTLRLTVCQSVCLGVEPRSYCWTVTVLFFGGGGRPL
jgi:hypothetical protein